MGRTVVFRTTGGQGQTPGRSVDMEMARFSGLNSLCSISHLNLVTVRSCNLLNGIDRGTELFDPLIFPLRQGKRHIQSLEAAAWMLVIGPVGNPIP